MRSLNLFFSRWQNLLGFLIVLYFVMVAVAAPALSPQDPKNPGILKVVGKSTDFQPHPPDAIAPLGTLSKQISVYHLVIWGARSALVFGLEVVLFASIIGVVVGVVAAYFGGSLHTILMRVTDSFLAFPVIAGVVLITQLGTILLTNAGVTYYHGGLGLSLSTQPTGTYIPENLPFWLVALQKMDPVMLAFILFSWMPYARIMDATVNRILHTEYIEAAQVIGAKNSRIIFRHILPNAISPAIVLAARDVGGMVLLQATFTFIGLGGNSPWGILLATGRDWIISAGGLFTYWWVFLPGTLALILFGIGWNLLGDGLNDVLNPRFM